jgi:cytochrome c551/c552/cbb3-type cytochrome oxidase cytochrome c subunit
MPDLLLEPISHRDAAGQVVSVSDPAEDLAEFLLQPSATELQPQRLPDLDEAGLDQLTLEYLRGAFHDSKAAEYVQHGIPADLVDTLRVAERELLVRDSGGEPAPGRGDRGSTRLSVAQKLRYVGSKAISKYGCFGCHDIPGFETAKQIGPPLSDWGRKDPKQLAFEHITDYLSDHRSGSSAAAGAVEASPEAAKTKAGEADSDEADAGKAEAYFRWQLVTASRIGFTYQKLAEPRSYDYRVVAQKAYHDRLRMPQFPFKAADREAIMTLLLGLVAKSPAEKYLHVPDSVRSAIIEGQDLLDRYQCATCHVLEPQKWHLAYQPGAFRPQPEKPVFPWVDHPFREDELQASHQADARGLLHATLAGMPTLADNGRPLVFDDCGDELFEDEDYLPQSLEYLFQLWQPAALEGREYQVGRGTLTVFGDQVIARQRASGGFLAQYLLPHVTELERAVNPNAKGSEAWGWLPPPLLGQGAKVQPGWLHDYLLAPYAIRPASLMRMPNYHLPAAEARVLVNYFAAQDGVDFPYQTVDRRNRTYLQQAQAAYSREPSVEAALADAPDPDRLAAAMRIVTDKNYCITCHIVGDFDPRTSDRAKGPDLADVYKRFRPEYLRRWLAEPVSVLPYTGMPVIVPYQDAAPHQGGVAQTLYPGTSIEQLDALVDLLMNFDVYTRRRAPVAPLVEAAGAAPAADPAPQE